MKYPLIFSLLLLLLSCTGHSADTHKDFHLIFSTAGLGSNMGKKMPTYRVHGTRYLYTNEQNSFYGERTLLPDTLAEGELPLSAIDSIMDLARTITDTTVYLSNMAVLSGVSQTLVIREESKSLTFSLHNASHPVARGIIEILNTHLPSNSPKMSLLDLDNL